MMRKLATTGVCAIVLLGGTAVSASAKGGSASGAHAGNVAGHASSVNGGHASRGAPAGGAGPVGFANGQAAPPGTPLCQPGVCPGRTQ
jgi:hypothetical protein